MQNSCDCSSHWSVVDPDVQPMSKVSNADGWSTYHMICSVWLLENSVVSALKTFAKSVGKNLKTALDNRCTPK